MAGKLLGPAGWEPRATSATHSPVVAPGTRYTGATCVSKATTIDGLGNVKAVRWCASVRWCSLPRGGEQPQLQPTL